jgi:hypothetical protein
MTRFLSAHFCPSVTVLPNRIGFRPDLASAFGQKPSQGVPGACSRDRNILHVI